MDLTADDHDWLASTYLELMREAIRAGDDIAQRRYWLGCMMHTNTAIEMRLGTVRRWAS